jgi:predicted Zn-dependent peptidase
MTIRRFLPAVTLAVLACLSPLVARADDPPAREKAPEPDAPRAFRLSTPSRFTLENGLKVTLVPYGSVPKALVRINVRSGNVNEAEKQVWLSNLTGDLLLEGTKTRSASRIAQDAAAMGGEVTVNAGEDATAIGGEVLSEFTPGMVALVADVVQNPAFPASELARLKADQSRRLSLAKSEPGQMATEAFRAAVYPGHPYGRIFPKPEEFQALTLDDAKAFYAANIGADRATLFVVGVFDAKATEAAIRTAFAGWRKATSSVPAAPPAARKKGFVVMDRPGASQSTLQLGLLVIDPSNPDYTSLLVTNALLGGSFGSRITSNIREQKGYTYSPNSSVSSRRRTATWVETADVTTNVTGPSLKEIFGEIGRLRAEPPSAAELKGIQNYLAGVFVLQNSSRAGIANQLFFLELHGLPDSYLTGFPTRVHAVTPEEVTRIAKTYIKPDEMTLVVVGDRKVIDEQLKPYAPSAAP